MHGDAQPKRGGRAAADGEAFAGGFNIRGKNRKKKNEKAKSSERASTGNQDADGAENFTDACEINQGHRIRKDGSHHTGKFSANLAEVRGASEEEHDGAGAAPGVHPGVKGGYPDGAERAKEKEGPIKRIRTSLLNILDVKKT